MTIEELREKYNREEEIRLGWAVWSVTFALCTFFAGLLFGVMFMTSTP